MKFKIFLLILAGISNLFSQRLWEINEPVFEEVMFLKDTSIAGLRNVILDKEKHTFEYYVAAKILAYYHEDTEKQFLLKNLNTEIIQVEDPMIKFFKMKNYKTDQIIRGYLGDQNAISGLENFINLTSFESDKLDAIAKLAESKIFKPDYYQFVENIFLTDSTYKSAAEHCLFIYGLNSQYKEEVKALFANNILSSNDHIEISSNCRSLFFLDRKLTINLLNQLFGSQSGDKRIDLYYDLNYFDPDGQTERSMWAIPREENEVIRSNYFPDFGSIEDGILSKSYLKPKWINFLLNWLQHENSNLITVPIHWFLNEFKPLPIFYPRPAGYLIDSLISLTDTVYSYEWLGNNNFENELKNKLITANINLDNKDSINCAIMIKGFQNTINTVYNDSLKSDARFITTEGWKFLYYNAQYILDKLSGISLPQKEIKKYQKIKY